MEHRVVLTVLAKERSVLAKIHILEVISYKASVTTLRAFAELGESIVFSRWHT